MLCCLDRICSLVAGLRIHELLGPAFARTDDLAWRRDVGLNDDDAEALDAFALDLRFHRRPKFIASDCLRRRCERKRSASDRKDTEAR
jgi:hypothetical protein